MCLLEELPVRSRPDDGRESGTARKPSSRGSAAPGGSGGGGGGRGKGKKGTTTQAVTVSACPGSTPGGTLTGATAVSGGVGWGVTIAIAHEPLNVWNVRSVYVGVGPGVGLGFSSTVGKRFGSASGWQGRVTGIAALPTSLAGVAWGARSPSGDTGGYAGVGTGVGLGVTGTAGYEWQRNHCN